MLIRNKPKELYNLASSAYSLIEQFNKPSESVMSLMYNENNVGPNMLPCRTLLDIDEKSDKKLPILTCWER